MAGACAVRGAATSRIGPALFGCLCCAFCCACLCRFLRSPAGAFIHLERFVSFEHALSGHAASADLLCSLVLLPSLCPGAVFSALLLTAGTVKFLCRFVLGTAFTRLEASFPQLRKNCCGFTHLTQLPPQGYRKPRKGSLVPVTPARVHSATPARVRSSQHWCTTPCCRPPQGFTDMRSTATCDAMRSDVMPHTSNITTNCGGATHSATTCVEM
jgi:hypothetical protein